MYVRATEWDKSAQDMLRRLVVFDCCMANYCLLHCTALIVMHCNKYCTRTILYPSFYDTHVGK
ncbi:MAG: hypothetical protein NC332_04510 [Firmicutes bacterium]|nr:hypothetical protein [Bacillota bacterium]